MEEAILKREETLDDRNMEIKVGIFVIVGIAILTIITLLSANTSPMLVKGTLSMQNLKT